MIVIVIRLCQALYELLMKKQLISSMAVWAIVTSSVCAQDVNQVARFTGLTKSESKSERVRGFESLGKYWREPNGVHAGFSDAPIDQSHPRAKKRDISDEELDSIATSIKSGIEDSDPDVRKAAAIALIGAPRSSESVLAAITAGIQSDDSTVNWYVMQQETTVWPEIDIVIDHLIDDLSDTDFNKHCAAGDLLRHYGKLARHYSKRIVEAIFEGEDDETDRTLKLFVLCDIGLTEDAMEILIANAAELTEDQSGIVAISLLEYPDALRSLSVQHPDLGQSLEKHFGRLFPFLCKYQNREHETKRWLASQSPLPANIMGMLGEPRFVNEIKKLEVNASKHQRTFLAACRRACGDKAETVIEVTSQKPVEFRPASAWPDTDATRRSKTSFGHGDGFTPVMVTGEIRGEEGTHPKVVHFFRTNDSMLLGSKQNYKEPVIYDPTNGRFVFLTTVFAAYSTGNDQVEPGPYQTGSAQIRVEAPGFEPIVIQFFDEIPDVRITLEKQKR